MTRSSAKILMLPLALITFVASCIYLLNEVSQTNMANSYWGNKTLGSGLWLGVNNSHVISVTRIERMNGGLVQINPTSEPGMAADVTLEIPSTQQKYSFKLPAKVNASAINSLLPKTNSQPEVTPIANDQLYTAINIGRNIAVKLVSFNLAQPKYDYVDSLLVILEP